MRSDRFGEEGVELVERAAGPNGELSQEERDFHRLFLVGELNRDGGDEEKSER